MDTLRRLGLGLAVLLFSLCISLVAILISLYFVLDTPEPLKRALNASGIYDVPAQDTLAETKDTSSLPTTDPGIQQALAQALPKSFLRDSSEEVIDSTYSWIKGETVAPSFSIDLTQVKINFANNVATYVQQKLSTLPLCDPLVAPPSTTADVLALTCLPRGVTPAAVADMARQEVLGNSMFADTSTINPATLKDARGRPLTDQLSFIPKLHTYYVISLYVLPVLTVFCMIAILFWSITKRAGVKRIAWLLITAGMTAAVLAIAQVWLLHAAATIFAPGSVSPTIQDKLIAVVEMLLVDLRAWWLGFGIAYVVIGITLLVILRFKRPKPTLAMGEERAYNPQLTLNDK